MPLEQSLIPTYGYTPGSTGVLSLTFESVKIDPCAYPNSRTSMGALEGSFAPLDFHEYFTVTINAETATSPPSVIVDVFTDSNENVGITYLAYIIE